MANPLDYTVGWICAVTTEYVAAQVFLDEKHPQPNSVSAGDTNVYTLGKIGNHNVVISVLPNGEYGLSTASSVASHMVHSFPNVRIGLMVGIGGGAPSRKYDIRLGDVVVSTTGSNNGGVFQYDFGKAIQDQEFKHTRFLNQPPTILRGAVTALQAQYEIDGHQIQDSIEMILTSKSKLKKRYQRPNENSDRLYLSHITHPTKDESSCIDCCGTDSSTLVIRPERTEGEDDPAIHYGLIASANTLCKDAKLRDTLATEKDVLCFEMEAAGLMNHFPCLVIRGICDYSDSHKNKEWQGYAAMTAAAYAKDLLQHVAPNRVEDEKKLVDVIAGLQGQISAVSKKTDTVLLGQQASQRKEILSWLTSVNYGSQHSDYLERHQAGTGQWLLDSAKFSEWRDNDHRTLFCPGIPGAGKTIATAIIINHLETRYRGNGNIAIAYVYCTYRLQKDQITLKLLMDLLAQLVQALPTFPEEIELRCRHLKEKGYSPSLEEVSTWIEFTIKQYDKVYILIDALDECQSNATFLQALFSIQAESGFKLLATARPLPEISENFISALQLEIVASHSDVGTYLEARMGDLRSFVREDPELKSEIKMGISEAVDGMFLLAQIYLDSLCDKLTPNGIREALELMRSQRESAAGMEESLLESAYDIAISRIKEQSPGLVNLAMQVLAWITLAKRPLTATELRHALAIRVGARKLDPGDFPDISDVISVCAGLVTTDEQGRIIRLAHYTTQEYLLQRHKRNEVFPEAGETITRACVTYLAFDVLEHLSIDRVGPTMFLRNNPFYEYAAMYWADHARGHVIEFQETIDFLNRENKVLTSAYVITFRERRVERRCNSPAEIGHWSVYPRHSRHAWPTSNERLPSHLAGLLLSTYLGLNNSASRLVKSYDWNSDDAFTSMLLSYAVDWGNLTIRKPGPWSSLVSFLDARKTHAKHQNFFHFKPLYWKLRVVDHARNWGLGVARSPILWIVDGEKVSIRTGIGPELLDCDDMARSLLKREDIQFNVARYDGSTPILQAVEANCENMVRLLLNTNRVDIARSDNTGRTPLLTATHNENLSIANMILEAGDAGLDKGDEDGRTPLFEAAENGWESFVHRLLISHRYDAKTRSQAIFTLQTRARPAGQIRRIKFENRKMWWEGEASVLEDNEYGETPARNLPGGIRRWRRREHGYYLIWRKRPTEYKAKYILSRNRKRSPLRSL